jgi:hypothetical protein
MADSEKCKLCGAGRTYSVVRDYNEEGRPVMEEQAHGRGGKDCLERQLAQAKAALATERTERAADSQAHSERAAHMAAVLDAERDRHASKVISLKNQRDSALVLLREASEKAEKAEASAAAMREAANRLLVLDADAYGYENTDPLTRDAEDLRDAWRALRAALADSSGQPLLNELERLRGIVRKMAAWSKRWPRGRVYGYPVMEQHYKELYAIEDEATREAAAAAKEKQT